MSRLCDTQDLGPGEGRVVNLGDREVAVLNVGGTVHAWLNVCPHQGRSLNFAPDQFLFTPGGRLVCPHHGACFDPGTGACTDGPCKGDALTAVAIVVRDGGVWLDERPGTSS